MDTGIMLNEDNSHFFYTRGGSPITDEVINAFVDQYADTQVRELLFSVNAMRTSYGSSVWDPIWRGYDPAGPDDQKLFASLPPEQRSLARQWIHAAWSIDQRGVDIYERWISMRMNDIHSVDDEDAFMHSRFWKDHPEYRRVGYRFATWTDRAFDYGREEVRASHDLTLEWVEVAITATGE